MATLVVATSADAASVGPAAALLSMPGWQPGPSFQIEASSSSSDNLVESFANGPSVRLLKHERSIVEVDDLDLLWQLLTGEPVHEVIFLSRHAAATNRPALTIHPIGEVPLHGGKAGWVGIPNTRMGPWIRLLREVAQEQCLIPEFEITLEATHHGPVVHSPTMFVEIDAKPSLDFETQGHFMPILIGSTEEYWRRQDASQAIASLVWRGLGLDGGQGIGKWDGKNKGDKVVFGIGGGHYVPRHMDIILKDGIWVGHLLAGYSLPMDGNKHRQAERSDADCIGGKWKQALEVSLEATKLAFPGGHIIAHLDNKLWKVICGLVWNPKAWFRKLFKVMMVPEVLCQVDFDIITNPPSYKISAQDLKRSFKGWQRNAITSFLTKRKIYIGKSADFF